MGRWQTRWGFLCLAQSAASSGMPVASFFHSMFFADSVGAEDGVGYAVVETPGGDGGRGSTTKQRDFMLDTILYSGFNAIGQAQFNILQQKGLDSACWRHAAASIEADCATMTHARKQRLAVQLSNCHMQDAGRKPTRCNIRDRDEDCVEEMKHNDVAFASYTTFFHHVNAICHHLSHSIWQEQTEGLVRGLTASSLATFDRTEKSLEKQELVLRGQELASEQSQGIADGLSETSVRLTGLSDSLSQELMTAMREIEKQEAVLANLLSTQAIAAAQATSFSNELGSAKSELASYMQAIEADRRATRDQNLALADTIGFIHNCLENASSAWARFQAFTYLILAANLCWVLTTAPPLRSARTALFLLVAFGLLLERYLCGDPSEGEKALPEWLVAGLSLSTSGSWATATWTKVFLQEKIRWLTFQACAVFLGHALVSYYAPCLTPGRILRLVRDICMASLGSGASSRSAANSNNNSCNNSRQHQGRRRSSRSGEGDTNNNGGLLLAVRGGRRASAGGPRPRLLRYDSSGGSGGGSSGERLDEPREGSSPSSTQQDGGFYAQRGKDEDGAGTDGADVNDNNSGDDDDGDDDRGRFADTRRDESQKRGGEGGRRGEEDGGGSEASADDGLDSLSRKELQCLAKKADGTVKANQSTPDIIRGLRDAGYASNTDGGY